MQLFDLGGRTALVTGSSTGIGFSLARGLAAHGARLVLNGRNREKLAAAAEALRGEGAEVRELPFDVTDGAAAAAAIDGHEAAQGPIDILVNNAGMTHRSPLEDFPPEQFDRIMATNVASIFHVSRAVARHMIPRGRGKMINIASVQSALSRPGIAPYCASKGAVANFTKGMATDWAPKGLNCNAIAPGYFETELTAPLVADAEFSGWLRKRTPAGRWGKVEDLTGACVFLASPASDFVNGHVLYVDGGITACL
ncbi:SDR family oxidoreductase [Paralimibaculum aggregatum]|uniref:SDR family oxidoreductase n=1 Tax=Paralimibaculum aggregatum TaxID=3036245 RepID=A0ABQ6LP62_9RHOB|nr:SDR family oxidoreductase [Limibaculum sp. NKW23]GMG84159.1 SDR family oxidoreductase [Limibaculum sp. NKW23]